MAISHFAILPNQLWPREAWRTYKSTGVKVCWNPRGFLKTQVTNWFYTFFLWSGSLTTPPSLVVITSSICGHKEQEQYDGCQTFLEIFPFVYPLLFNTVRSHSEMPSDHEWESEWKTDERGQWIWAIFQEPRWLCSNGKVNEPFKTILTLIIESPVNPNQTQWIVVLFS